MFAFKIHIQWNLISWLYATPEHHSFFWYVYCQTIEFYPTCNRFQIIEVNGNSRDGENLGGNIGDRAGHGGGTAD